MIESRSRERKTIVEVWSTQLFEAVLSHLPDKSESGTKVAGPL